MGRKRKLNRGVILSIYLDHDQYIQLVSKAYKVNKSVSEYVRDLLCSILSTPIHIDGGSIDDLRSIKSDLLLDEAREKLKTIKNLTEKLRNMKPWEKQTLQYFQLKHTWKKLTIELIDFIEKNQKYLDQKFINEVKMYLRNLAV